MPGLEGTRLPGEPILEDEWLTPRDMNPFGHTCLSLGPGNESKMRWLGQKTSKRGSRGSWVSHMC